MDQRISYWKTLLSVFLGYRSNVQHRICPPCPVSLTFDGEDVFFLGSGSPLGAVDVVGSVFSGWVGAIELAGRAVGGDV